MKHPVYRSFV